VSGKQTRCAYCRSSAVGTFQLRRPHLYNPRPRALLAEHTSKKLERAPASWDINCTFLDMSIPLLLKHLVHVLLAPSKEQFQGSPDMEQFLVA
jgi:hypothetical protein